MPGVIFLNLTAKLTALNRWTKSALVCNWSGFCPPPKKKPAVFSLRAFFAGNTELSLELWTVIAGISGFDD